jgi:hypothetical protein
MNRLFHKLHPYTFFLILSPLTSLSVYFLFKAVTITPLEPFPGRLTNAFEVCNISQKSDLLIPFELRSLSRHSPEKAKSLQIGSIKLTASSHSLTAKTKEGKDVAAVSQPDYGVVRSLHITESGEIFAIGDQISYRLEASLHDGKPLLSESMPLPFLFSKTCGFFGRITRSCYPASPTYSEELEAIFFDGYSTFGNYRSLVLGLEEGDQDISNSGTPHFQGDIRGTGRALMWGPEGFALFNGETMTPCQGNDQLSIEP